MTFNIDPVLVRCITGLQNPRIFSAERRQNARPGGAVWPLIWRRLKRRLPGVTGGWGGVRRAGRRPVPVFRGAGGFRRSQGLLNLRRPGRTMGPVGLMGGKSNRFLILLCLIFGINGENRVCQKPYTSGR